MFKEIFEKDLFTDRSKKNQKFVDKYNLRKGMKLQTKKGPATITQVRSDMFVIKYDSGGVDGIYFDELKKYGIKFKS